MREQHITTRHIDRQDRPQRKRNPLINTPRSRNRAVHEPALARDAERVQDGEGVVAQKREEGGHAQAAEGEDEVAVAHDFGEGPGEQHRAVGGRVLGSAGEGVRDAPDKEEAGGYLHEGGEEGGANDA